MGKIDGVHQIMVLRSFHTLPVDGREVQLRVFKPDLAQKKPSPTVVMVCGLGFLGEGALGWTGKFFNDAFGKAFAVMASLACRSTPLLAISHTLSSSTCSH